MNKNYSCKISEIKNPINYPKEHVRRSDEEIAKMIVENKYWFKWKSGAIERFPTYSSLNGYDDLIEYYAGDTFNISKDWNRL